ncbi:hypothetical protein [Stieleria neptunia]|nr:hypothetical protein [Stieleria neptunia]
MSAKLVNKSYRVSDLVLKDGSGEGFADFSTLMESIVSDVEPESWESNGGPGTLRPYPQNLSLIVSQTSRGHEALDDYLQEHRDVKAGE